MKILTLVLTKIQGGESLDYPCSSELANSAVVSRPEGAAEILQEGLYSLQHDGLDTGDALEALHGCLDPSILSIFEDSTNGAVKSDVDDESETTLLTALTEILDNVDDENLSPFDTLPDMELLQKAQKHSEHSPLRKLLSFSCSPPERESTCNSKQFSKKRHDGIEDDAATFSKLMHDLDVSSELDWCLPISLEQDGETVSVTLSDLVKHMHPYAMTLCVEGKEQLLPEGGIILEVMDKGEHGEPILSIPDLSFPLSLNSFDDEQNVLESSPDKNISQPEDPSSKVVKDNKWENGKIEQPRKDARKKRPSKKKLKTGEAKTIKGLVLRSMSCREAIKEQSKNGKEQKSKKKVTFAPELTSLENKKSEVVSSEIKTTEVHRSMEILSSTINATVNPTSSQVCTKAIKTPLYVPDEKPTPSESSNNNCREMAASLEQQSEVSQPSEPKQKSLSLQQYRLLRQQKKPCPMEKVADNSTKWPTLPEAPKELFPIPCLPEPNLKDPRRAAPVLLKKETVSEIMPAWKPRGPGAPPTPQALLVPPESMLAASKKKCKSVSPPSTKPAENSDKSTSFSTQSCPQELPIPTHVATNTIPNDVSQAAKQASSEIIQLAPMATTVRETQNFSAANQVKDFKNPPFALNQAAVSQLPGFTNDQEPQVVPEIVPITKKTDTAKAAFNNLNAASIAEQLVKTPVPKSAKASRSVSATKPIATYQRHVSPIALQPFATAPIQARIMKLAEQMRIASAAAPKAKSHTVALIQSFTSEIGIEASDLTSLLEQFEETQTKEEKNMPVVCGRAAAVGNSSVEQHEETTVLKKACSPDLGNTAGLTPPATPPHQMWKPLAPVTLLEKPSKSEMAKPTPTKAIQIEPLPLRPSKLQSKTQIPVTVGKVQPFSLDHDYCLQEPSQNERVNLGPAKEQQIIKSTVLPPANSSVAAETDPKVSTTTTTKESIQKNVKPQTLCASHTRKEVLTTTGLVTPDASPERLDSERFRGYSERSLSPCHQKRGRSQRKYRTRLSSRSRSTSSSSGSSSSCSPPRKRCRSRSTSRSPSRYRTRSRSSSPHQRRYSCSSSDSWSRSRSRSPSHSRSPPCRYRHWDAQHSSNQRSNYYDFKHNNEEIRRHKEKAIEERRVVYIGRIHGSMTRNELRERFSYFGEIEECTVHFREHGDNYGFVTYYNNKDAFNAIENGSKLRQPNELPFDLCFGGRRQFYSNRDYDPASGKARVNALDFDTLLKQAQRNLKR
ncbi:Peroxisome proliferator-activated receptor gamma coactivator-related protein 1 [Bagarius yarrelli]|uniref:Peroxisome proliferator-activated receptor gamma coactivator-related protein 1 n=1 Tax=Bagarius yarrelli TaxID=175774 RepID=A0A556TRE1_BAGYA|nr:Peroxisome proliferator-activated receptor gamma coactivator-related protein 1 [Bagarius yarrelli]